MFFLLINKDRIKVVLRNGKILYWNNLQVRNYVVAFNLKYSNDAKVEFYPELDKMTFNYKGKGFTFYGFLEDGWIYHEFVNFEYNQLNFKDKTVLDIGANSGATSIFFVLGGAKYVIAIEPMPKTYSILEKNIEVNNLAEKIMSLNFGVGKHSNVNLSEDVSGQGPYIKSVIQKTGKTVEIKSLSL